MPSLGSISHGTLRAVDLLDSFADALEQCAKEAMPHPGAINPDHMRLVAEARDWLEGEWEEGEEDNENDLETAAELMSQLQDALAEYAPSYCYFGAHEGDGSDFGFWVSMESLEDFDGLRVDDLSKVPPNYQGEVLHVNDHSNMTLYYTLPSGKLCEAWGIV